MKKNFFYAAFLLISVSAFASPTTNILKSFSNAFPNATNVKWDDERNGYAVSFTQNGNFEKVLYDKKGDFVCSWKYSDGKQLPANLVMDLQKNYQNNKIIGVTEFTNDEGMVYNVKLSCNETLYSIDASGDGKVTSAEKLN